MIKRYFSIIALALMGCSDAPIISGADDKVAAARERNDGPAIWTVTDFDSTLYLYGTVHLLPSDLDWQKDDMRAAFKEAGTVFFEVDTGTDGQIQAAVLTTSLGMRSDGLRLSDRLDSYQLKLLDAAAHNGDITLAALDSMQPWLASESSEKVWSGLFKGIVGFSLKIEERRSTFKLSQKKTAHERERIAAGVHPALGSWMRRSMGEAAL